MGQLGAMVGLGVILGPLFGGLLSANSLSLPFFVGSALAFIALLLVIFLLPESKPIPSSAGELSLSAEQPPTDQSDSSNPAQKHLRVLDIYLRIIFSPAGVLLLLNFIMSFGMTNFQGMIGLYAVDKFAFNTKQVGTIWMVMGGVLILGQGFLVGPLTKRLGELNLIRIGLLGGAIGFAFVALANDYITTLMALGLFILSLALIGPSLNSSISNFAGEHQGTAMGLNSASTSLGRVVGPLWGGYIYDIRIEYPFFSGAATLLIGLLVSVFGLQKYEQARLIQAHK